MATFVSLLNAAAVAVLLMSSPALAGVAVTSTEPCRYDVTITNDTGDNVWVVDLDSGVAMTAENLPVNWNCGPLDATAIAVWSGLVSSDLPDGGVMRFTLVTDDPITELWWMMQTGDLGPEGTVAIPEPGTLGMLTVAGLFLRRTKKAGD